jgi:hypothetical protein
VTNTLAYYGSVLITVVKSFIVKASGRVFRKKIPKWSKSSFPPKSVQKRKFVYLTVWACVIKLFTIVINVISIYLFYNEAEAALNKSSLLLKIFLQKTQKLLGNCNKFYVTFKTSQIHIPINQNIF